MYSGEGRRAGASKDIQILSFCGVMKSLNRLLRAAGKKSRRCLNVGTDSRTERCVGDGRDLVGGSRSGAVLSGW